MISGEYMEFFGLPIGPEVRNVLLDLESLGRSGEFWNVPRSTGVLLSSLVRLLGARNVLEIGTSNGYSGIFLASSLGAGGGKLFTVESHKERFRMAAENFQRAGVVHCVEQIAGHAPEVLEGRFPDGSFDMAFFDATKVEYSSYLESVTPLLRKGGLLVADNVLSHEKETRPFVLGIQKDTRFRSYLLDMDNGLLLCFKDS